MLALNQGLNIDFLSINEPIIVLRYLSFFDSWYLYPFELNTNEAKNLSRFDLKSFYRTVADNYVSLVDYEILRSTNKNTNCEANIYLHPLNERSASYLYKNDYRSNNLKTPFQLNLKKASLNHLNSITKYSLLICHTNKDSTCCNKKEPD